MATADDNVATCHPTASDRTRRGGEGDRRDEGATGAPEMPRPYVRIAGVGRGAVVLELAGERIFQPRADGDMHVVRVNRVDETKVAPGASPLVGRVDIGIVAGLG
jgi:hypothetical protein